MNTLGNPSEAAPAPSRASSLPSAPARRPRKRRSWGKWVVALVLLAGLVAGWRLYAKRPKEVPVDFRTATLSTGDIVQEVTANGALSPVKNVEVGSQVSGIIQEIAVDFNSQVKEGDLLARIDPSSFEQNVAQSEAELANAQASLELAEVNYRRAEELFGSNLISASEYDSARASHRQAQASVRIREAAVQRAQVDLSRTQIYAPISGVVISRSVDEGQTVAASFNTPRLFLIANDLTKMQIEAAVSEADVGGVEDGQRVTFSVDAFPTRRFDGVVKQVRFAPSTNQNVVNYTAVVEVNNPDMKLRPGMTATAKIITAEKRGVLRIPNAALRFRPPPNLVVQPAAEAGSATTNAPTVATDASGMPIAPWMAERRRPTQEEREQFEAALTPEQRARYDEMRQQMMRQRGDGGPGGGGRGPGGGEARPRAEGPVTATVYVLEPSPNAGARQKNLARAVTVRVGITDGSQTEVLSGLSAGDTVITGINSGTTVAGAAPAAPGGSPFGSPFGGGGMRPR